MAATALVGVPPAPGVGGTMFPPGAGGVPPAPGGVPPAPVPVPNASPADQAAMAMIPQAPPVPPMGWPKQQSSELATVLSFFFLLIVFFL